jgi:hypothetical protein
VPKLRLSNLIFSYILFPGLFPGLPLPLHGEPRIAKVLDISRVWSGHPVGFAFLTRQDRQFIAFYDDQRRMTVASRTLDSDHWQLVRLPSTLAWDSHNYIAMVIDDDGYIHLSGNMHAIPLVYFRTSKPLDIGSFQQIPHMTGPPMSDAEARCTYPIFFRGPTGNLIFTYRDGVSGNGNQIYNTYDLKSHTWTRLLDQPLTSNQGHVSAYLEGPGRGPDGYFHLIWVWRNTPDCATNHDLSYARSRDLIHWESSDGQPLKLPITTRTAEVIDPVPVNGGLINGAAHLGWDSRKRPVVAYHKFDGQGFTQAYAARLEEGHWKIYKISDWDYRWEFHGGGSIPFEIRLGSVRPGASGELLLDYHHITNGSGTWRLDENTLQVIGKATRERAWPASLDKPESEFPRMQVHTLTNPGQKGVLYVLRWESLGPNRDRPREGPVPEPSTLRLYEILQP